MIFNRVPEAAQGDPTERPSEINALNSLPILLSPTRLPLTRPLWKPEGKATLQSASGPNSRADKGSVNSKGTDQTGRSQPLKNDIA